MPPVAPQVSYRDGLLQITANNSTMKDILTAVGARTGAKIDMPADASSERVAIQIGPGDPHDVIAALLEGSRFDYIVMGTENNPNAVSQVILTTRQGAAGAPAMASAGTPVSAPPPGSPGVNRPPFQPQMPPEEVEENPEPAPQPVTPVQPPATMAQPQQQNAAPGANSAGGGAAQGGPKTPEQLLQELQSMQQREQQQQQQRGGRRPPQNPQ